MQPEHNPASPVAAVVLLMSISFGIGLCLGFSMGVFV